MSLFKKRFDILKALCYFQQILKTSLNLQSILTCDTITVVRCIFLFVLKNVDRFQDDFWNRFIRIWIVGFCAISQFVFLFLPGQQALIFYICLGKVPSNRTAEWRDEGPKKNHILTYITVVSTVLQFLAGLKIIVHKLQLMKIASEEECDVIRGQLKSIAFASILFILVASLFRLLALKINQVQIYICKQRLVLDSLCKSILFNVQTV